MTHLYGHSGGFTGRQADRSQTGGSHVGRTAEVAQDRIRQIYGPVESGCRSDSDCGNWARAYSGHGCGHSPMGFSARRQGGSGYAEHSGGFDIRSGRSPQQLNESSISPRSTTAPGGYSETAMNPNGLAADGGK